MHPQTVRVWIREGRIPSQKFGGSRRIPRDELLASSSTHRCRQPRSRRDDTATIYADASQGTRGARR